MAGLLSATVTFAQEEGSPDETTPLERTGPTPGVEEMVIISERLTATEFDAPDSVTSFGAEDLAAMGIEDLDDLAVYTPNLEIRSAGATSSTFFVRGVGLNDFTSNAAGAVAIYQDDVPMNLPAIQLIQLFDVQEAETLRGPQGAGPGRNASAGAIKVYTRKPTGELDAFLRSEFGNLGSRLFEGAVEVPLTQETLSTRLSFLLLKRDPFVENGCANAPPPGLARVTIPDRSVQPSICGETLRESIANPNPPPTRYSVSRLPVGLPEEVNDRDSWAARGHFRLLPPDSEMDWLFSLHGAHIDQQATLGQPIGTGEGYFGGSTSGYRQPEIAAEEERIFEKLGGPSATTPEERSQIRAETRKKLGENLARRLDSDPYRGDYDLPGKEEQTSYGGFLRGEYEFDFGRFLTVSGYEYYDRDRVTDADFTPNVIFESDVKDRGWQFSEDLRLQGELDDGALLWDFGGFYLMDHIDYTSKTITGPALIDLTRSYDQDSWSFGIYAGFTWDFLDDFTLEGGVRYNWERKSFDVFLDRSGGEPCQIQECNVADTWDAPTGTLSLSYDFWEDLSVYAKYSRGWKGPQYNAGGASGKTVTLAEPESIDAWEIGLSSSWFDDRLTARGSLFYYAYKNYQVFITQNDAGTPPQRIVINADDAEVYGAELETTITPFEGLVLSGRFSWLESEFLDFTNQVFRIIPSPQPPPVNVPVTIDYTGNRLPNTPRYKVSVTAEYTLDMGRYGFLIPRYDFVWTDDVFFDPSDGRGSPNAQGEIFMPEYAIGQPAYSLHNLRVAYRTPSEHIEIAGWVRNLTDEVYKTLAFDASAAANLVGNLVGDPRTYGVTLVYSF